MASLPRLLLAVTGRTAAPGGAGWLGGLLAAPPGAADREPLLDALAAAGRRLGGAPVALEAGEEDRLRSAGLELPLFGRRTDEVGRLALLLAAAERLEAPALVALVDEAYRHGSAGERQGVLRSLALLPDPGRFVAIGVDACRSHIQPVFEAIACENPYPARYFPEPAFNQMVLKALFTGVALERIAGLDARVTPELARMALGYARERELAGRSVPPDIGRLTGRGRSEP